MGWITAGDGYELSLVDGKVACRSRGKTLRSLPKALKDHDAVTGLRQLADWLTRHERECTATVEDWMIRSLPVPAAVVCAVWLDPVWRAALRDLVVVPVAGDTWSAADAGFLREAGDGTVGLVTLDGDSVRSDAERLAIPHPVLLDDLDDLREFAADLDVRQGVLQLFRETWARPGSATERATAAAQYSGGRFAQLSHLTARAAALGYTVRGGYAGRRLWDAGRAIDARVWLGAEDPWSEAETGELMFTDAGGSAIPLADVGGVAWSEGLRMAAGLYAGRVVAEERAA